MNQNYSKLLYDDMLNNDPTRSNNEAGAADRETAYRTASNVRNVNFVLLNGDMQFMNYAYLITGKYRAAENCILLCFASHEVKLTGIYLIPLYFDFTLHLPQNVMCVDARYNVTAEKNKPIVNDITIEKNKP